MENDIQVIDKEFDDILGTQDVADLLGIPYQTARTLMNQKVIKSIRINGLITKRKIVEKYRLQRQS
jgi:hypothetical protein